MADQTVTLSQLESHLWESANILRGPVDAADFKTYIFPLLFFKRICDVWDEEYQEIVDETGDEQLAWFPESHRFQIPEDCHWNDVREVASNVGNALQRAMREIEKANPDSLYGVFGDAQWANKERLSDALLKDLIEHFSRLSFGNDNINSDLLGDAYEYLIKKFADATNKKAGEFYTPRSVVRLMVEMLDPKEGETIYDPACGTGGMLLAAVQHVKDRHGDVKRLWGKLFGQEKNLTTSSIARMNLFLHGIEDFQIVRGDTLRNPAFFEVDRLAHFDCVIANPPFSLEKWGEEMWTNDPFGRNFAGLPPSSSGDFAWVQHMVKSMAEVTGRMAVVLPQGALFRKGAEGAIRQKLLEMDLVEAVIGLAPNLFYGTGLAACILVLRKKKSAQRRNKVMIADASRLFRRGRAQNYLEPEHALEIQNWFQHYEDVPDAVRVVGLDEIKAENWTLNISRYVLPPLQEDIPPLPVAIAAFKDALTRCREAEDRLAKVMAEGGWLSGSSDEKPPPQARKDAVEDYIDEDLGWHIHLERIQRSVEYEYTELSTGEKISGSATADFFESPQRDIRKHLDEQAERQELRDAGVTGEQISRRVMEMVGILHERGFQSIYLDPYMAPSGMAWRYHIGVMNAGCWPVPESQLITRGSISGGMGQRLDWANATDAAEVMADKFIARFGESLEHARESNPEYAAWYREMLERTKPEGTLIFMCDDDQPAYEYAFTWFEPRDFRMPLPPGFVRRRGGAL